MVSIRTQALFDNVITVYQYNQQSLAPELGTAKCAVSSLGSGQLVASVKKGADYTVQVGAISNPGADQRPARLLPDPAQAAERDARS